MKSDKVYITLFSSVTIKHPESDVRTPVTSKKVSQLIGLLALAPEFSRTRESLHEILYPEQDPEDSGRKLRQVIYELRRLLEPEESMKGRYLLSTPVTVKLNPETVETDVSNIDAFVRAAGATITPAERLKLLRLASDLYTGRLLPGLNEEPIANAARYYEQLQDQTLHLLVEAALSVGDVDAAREASKQFLKHSPENQVAHQDRFLSLLADEDLGGARRIIKDLERSLSVPPSKALTDWFDRHLAAAEVSSSVSVVPASRPAAEPRIPEPPSGPMSASGVTTAPPVGRSTRGRLLRRRNVIGVGFVILALVGYGVFRKKPSEVTKPVPKDPVYTYRYQPEGKERDSKPIGIATDPDGNIFVGGFVDNTSQNVDYLLLKFDPWLKPLWKRKFNGKGNDLDRMISMGADQFGNVVVTGESDNGKGNGLTRLSGLDIITIKYDRDGNVKWKMPYNSKSDGEDRPVKLLMNDDSRVLVLGTSVVRVTPDKKPIRKMVVIQYNKAGIGDWNLELPGDPDRDYVVEDAIETTKGQYIVSGVSVRPDSPRTSRELVTALISGRGNVEWIRAFPAPLGDRLGGTPEQRESRTVVRQLSDRGDYWVVSSARTTAADGKKYDLVIVCYDYKGTKSWSLPFSESHPYPALVTGVAFPQPPKLDHTRYDVKVLVSTRDVTVGAGFVTMYDFGWSGVIAREIKIKQLENASVMERGLSLNERTGEFTILYNRHSDFDKGTFGKANTAYWATTFNARNELIRHRRYPAASDTIGYYSWPWIANEFGGMYSAIQEDSGTNRDITVVRMDPY